MTQKTRNTKPQFFLPEPEPELGGSGSALVVLGIICLISWLSASAGSAMLTGGALAAAGLLMVWQPVRLRVPPGCWIGAGLWVGGVALTFLPSDASAWPAWRESLAAAGVDTGRRHTPQPLAALGSLAVMAATGLVALWAACQGCSHHRRLATGFVATVAIYALLAWLGPGLLNFKANASGHFGFFPNRNHTATLLVMGCMASLGLMVQGARWRHPWQTGAAVVLLVFFVGILFSLTISRAGIILLATGGGLWILLAGRRYLQGHVGKAVALTIVAAVLILPLLNTPVRQRLEESIEKVVATAEGGEIAPWSERLDHLDSRFAIQRDTIAMIADAPLSGWGAGQFGNVFRQYQGRSAKLSESVCLHPESDWLWMAAETGIPATLGLAGVVLALVLPAVSRIRRGRVRALRAGLLVAALVLPLHGFLDVPGHKFALLWTAAGLLALAAGEQPATRFPRVSIIGWRLAGTAVAALGAFMVYGSVSGSPLLAADRSEHLLAAARALYLEEQRRSLSETPGSLDPPDDPLEIGIKLLDQAAVLTPLDARVAELKGMLALHFDDKDEIARQSFAIQRALEPNRISAPLAQADGWARINPQETRNLWIEAMQRARRMEQRFPGTPWEDITLKRIQQTARGSEALKEAAMDAAGGEPD